MNTNKMTLLNFALAQSELGISHFTSDLILVLSFAIVTALPMSLLRPQIQEDKVKSSVFKKWYQKAFLHKSGISQKPID